ncbi:hypothetical protein SEVIR_9G272500v4 [Setaria viridis]|uniref:Uncharacterized protein n=1 Tax=Setaria viridis TaxID=4556 RepID=A0A4U6TAM0_SETVI|nr:hypothetical protein SEVIR_9G272500v2 [Setaria viridis]TKV94116.1 hypothetical protein SEVIR_9G272500v2 [Setaria viridis]
MSNLEALVQAAVRDHRDSVVTILTKEKEAPKLSAVGSGFIIRSTENKCLLAGMSSSISTPTSTPCTPGSPVRIWSWIHRTAPEMHVQRKGRQNYWGDDTEPPHLNF